MLVAAYTHSSLTHTYTYTHTKVYGVCYGLCNNTSTEIDECFLFF